MEPSNDSVFGVVAAFLLVFVLVVGVEVYWRGYHTGECAAYCKEQTHDSGVGELDDHGTCICRIGEKVTATH